MGKTVLITGATRGIGLALAKKFKSEGYNVVGTCISSINSITELKKQNIDILKADVSSYEEMNGVFRYAKNKYGKIDVVINNAGVALNQKFILDVTEDEFDRVINVNLKGVFNVTKLAVNEMLATGGAIINLSSVFALKGGSCEAVYSASKGGALAFSRAVAEELGASNISVCSVVLGLIDTDMNNHLTNEEKLEFVKESGLKKIPTAKAVASKIFNILKKENLNGKTYKIFTGKLL
jgi:3-oxoacyl-[acyl-carrier protein] reductase